MRQFPAILCHDTTDACPTERRTLWSRYLEALDRKMAWPQNDAAQAFGWPLNGEVAERYTAVKDLLATLNAQNAHAA